MKKGLCFLFGLCSILQMCAQQVNANKQRVAVKGYDLVSYYNANPKKGTMKYMAKHQGVDYLFFSAENREKFKANPSQFLPAYGGWCAYAMAKGERVDINPLAFSIENGRLFLFYKTVINDTRSKWLRNNATLKEKADNHWRNLTQSN